MPARWCSKLHQGRRAEFRTGFRVWFVRLVASQSCRLDQTPKSRGDRWRSEIARGVAFGPGPSTHPRPMTAKGLVGERTVSLGLLDHVASFLLRLTFSTNATLQVKQARHVIHFCERSSQYRIPGRKLSYFEIRHHLQKLPKIVKIKVLLKPGSILHSSEPCVQSLSKLQNQATTVNLRLLSPSPVTRDDCGVQRLIPGLRHF